MAFMAYCYEYGYFLYYQTDLHDLFGDFYKQYKLILSIKIKLCTKTNGHQSLFYVPESFHEPCFFGVADWVVSDK